MDQGQALGADLRLVNRRREMSRATLETIGEAGDVMNRCEALLHLLRQLEGRVSGTEQLTPEKEAAVLDANWRWSESSKDYVDRAFDAVNQWFKDVAEALGRPDNDEKVTHVRTSTRTRQAH